MQTIKAIETRYKGYRFRSRLEARYAVFFDTLGITYEYEKEGYDLGDAGWYLPDFWLPKVWSRKRGPGVWIEIKGQTPTGVEDNKCYSLTKQTNSTTLLFVGSPPGDEGDSGYEYSYDESRCNPDFPDYDGCAYDNYMRFMRCYRCGLVKIEFLEGNYCYCPKCNSAADENHPLILKAAAAARAARFEHGEQG